MTRADEVMYHILCARWKITNADLSQEEVQRLFEQSVGLTDRLGAMVSGKRKLLEADTTGARVQ